MKTESIRIQGKITIRRHKARTLEKVLQYLKNGQKKKAQLLLMKNQIGSPIVQKNTIMQSANRGMDLIIQQLNGFLTTPAYGIAINYIAIGTGNTTPAVTDTQLTAETNRGVVVYSQDSGFDELLLQSFFPDSVMTNQTYYEVGSFIDGTPSANSGQIFNHALLDTPYIKVAGQDTTIEIDIIFSQ